MWCLDLSNSSACDILFQNDNNMCVAEQHCGNGTPCYYSPALAATTFFGMEVVHDQVKTQDVLHSIFALKSYTAILSSIILRFQKN